MASTADLIVYGGDIITMEDDDSGATEALAIKDDVIIAIGSIQGVFQHAGETTEIIYLNKYTLLPGFIEPHHHVVMCALTLCVFTDINGCLYSTYSEIRDVMLKRVREIEESGKSGEWAAFTGWDPELVRDLPTLNAEVLDQEISSTIPVLVRAQNLHILWANGVALNRAQIDDQTPDPPGGFLIRDCGGKPTGKFCEIPAMHLITKQLPRPSLQTLTTAIKKRLQTAASKGFTAVTDLYYGPNQLDDNALKRATNEELCPVRVGLYVSHDRIQTDNPHGIFYSSIGNHSSKLRETGVKIIADGSPHCGTLATSESLLNMPVTETLGFPPPPNYGKLNFDSHELEQFMMKYHNEGKQIAIHTQGERAAEQTLQIYEKMLRDDKENKNRHRMEHCGLMTSGQIQRAGKINIALSFFVDHLRFYGPSFKYDILGDRANRWAAVGEASKWGIKWTIHQDHPAFPGDMCPFSNMKTAITRCFQGDPTTPYGPEYRVTIHEALKAYTINAAWQIHRDDDLGSLKVGKKADFIVISENPYKVDAFDLERINVIETFMGGRRTELSELELLKGRKLKHFAAASKSFCP